MRDTMDADRSSPNCPGYRVRKEGVDEDVWVREDDRDIYMYMYIYVCIYEVIRLGVHKDRLPDDVQVWVWVWL